MWILIYSFSDTYYVWAACGDIGVKIDCHMKPYADKLFVVLYFSVRSSRSSAHGRHFANIPWGRELGFYSARWVRKARKMETSRGHSALTDWAGKVFKWFAAWEKVKHEEEIMKIWISYTGTAFFSLAAEVAFWTAMIFFAFISYDDY